MEIKTMYDISIRRTHEGWDCATILNGQRVHKHYIGYSRNECVEPFIAYLDSLGGENSSEFVPDVRTVANSAKITDYYSGKRIRI